jgi:hypothetical protein
VKRSETEPDQVAKGGGFVFSSLAFQRILVANPRLEMRGATGFVTMAKTP